MGSYDDDDDDDIIRNLLSRLFCFYQNQIFIYFGKTTIFVFKNNLETILTKNNNKNNPKQKQKK